MKKVLLVIFPTFAEFEVTVATAVLKNYFEIVTTAPTRETVVGEAGLQFVPHLTFKEVEASNYEAIIVPGGDMAVFVEETAQPILRVIRELNQQGKIVAAICGGGMVLAKAGVLVKHPYTVTFNQEQRDFLGGFDHNQFRYEPLVESGNLITAQGHAFVEFGLKVGERLIENWSENVRLFYEGKANPTLETSLP